ncbi:MAG TPA: transaldolase family protein [Syntrophomonas sp.]|nr:transaldolase family protein [Syntrophomonas sp.]
MNNKSYFHRVQEQTQTRFWINNVTREEAKLAIEAGAVGCTQNPSYTWKMLNSPDEKAYAFEILDEILKTESDDNRALIKLQKTLVENIAEIFKPIYDKTKGRYGYVSIQGDPFHEDAETIIDCARLNCANLPNMMAKIPAVEGGLEAIAILAKEHVPINATEVMAVKQAIDVCEVYQKAIQDVEDPAIIYFSYIAGIFDEYLSNVVKEKDIDIRPDVLWQAGITVARKIHEIVGERNYPVGFISGGARSLHHFTEMVGANASVTINWVGTAQELIKQDPVVLQRFLQPTPYSVLDELNEKLPDFRKAYELNGITVDEYDDFGPVKLFRSMFESAWENSLKLIAERRQKV